MDFCTHLSDPTLIHFCQVSFWWGLIFDFYFGFLVRGTGEVNSHQFLFSLARISHQLWNYRHSPSKPCNQLDSGGDTTVSFSLVLILCQVPLTHVSKLVGSSQLTVPI
jgi:hypothetical protein